MKEMEYFIAGLFNGKNDIEAIAGKFEERFKAKIGLLQLEKFGTNLAAMGLLEGVRPADQVIERPVKKSLFGKLLFIKLKADNPEKFI